jgi:hypothetical protein
MVSGDCHSFGNGISPNALRVGAGREAMRTEMVHLTNAFTRYCKSAERLGWDVTGWTLTTGSRPQGIPYSVSVKGHAGASLPGVRDGDIGRTRGEAYDTLVTVANTLDDVAHFQDLSFERS